MHEYRTSTQGPSSPSQVPLPFLSFPPMPTIETLEDLLESAYYPRDDKQLASARKLIDAKLPKKLKSKNMPPRARRCA